VFYLANADVPHDDDVTAWACGESKPAEITTSGTRITSPVYDNGSYVLDQECQWQIHAKQGEVREYSIINK